MRGSGCALSSGAAHDVTEPSLWGAVLAGLFAVRVVAALRKPRRPAADGTPA